MQSSRNHMIWIRRILTNIEWLQILQNIIQYKICDLSFKRLRTKFNIDILKILDLYRDDSLIAFRLNFLRILFQKS